MADRAIDPGAVGVGTTLPPHTDEPLTVTDFVRYQGASGDINPIHHDTGFAQRSGFEQPFAVGMLQAGVAATYVTDLFGAESVRAFRVRFRELAWPGDQLTYQGQVVAVREQDAQRVADLTLTCTRQTGGVHLEGWATVILEAGPLIS